MQLQRLHRNCAARFAGGSSEFSQFDAGGEKVGVIKWVIAMVVFAALTLLLGYLAWKAEQQCESYTGCFACYAFGIGAAFTGVLALTAGIRFVIEI